MTDHKDARQLLADITAGLEGVTPGPWRSYEHPWGATNVTTARNSSLDEDIIASCHVKQDGDHFRRCDPETMQTIDREFTALTLGLASAKQRIAELEAERQWQPIETAPEVKGDAFFCNVAWGPDDDKCTGRAFRTGGKWFAAAVFYRGKKDKIVEFKEIEVHPSHWMYSIDLPLPASPHEGTQS